MGPRFKRAVAVVACLAFVAAGYAIGRFEHSGTLGPRATLPPAAEVHYGPEENLEAIGVKLIDDARKTVNLVAYVLTDGAVIGALGRAAARGVAVRVWRDGERRPANRISANGSARPSPPHCKFARSRRANSCISRDFASMAPRSAPVRPISALPARGGRTTTSSSYADLRPARYLKRSSRGRGRASPEAPPG